MFAAFTSPTKPKLSSDSSVATRSTCDSRSTKSSKDYDVLVKELIKNRVEVQKAKSNLAASLLRVGEYHVRNGEYEEAMNAFQDSLNENRSVCSASVASITEVSDSCGESLISGLSSSQISGMYPGKESLSSNASVAYSTKDNASVYSSAMSSSISDPESLMVHKKSLGDMITTLSNLGKVHSLRGEERSAVKYYEEKSSLQAIVMSLDEQISISAAGCLGSPAAFFGEGHANIMSEINEDVKALDELFRGISFRKGTTEVVQDELKLHNPKVDDDKCENDMKSTDETSAQSDESSSSRSRKQKIGRTEAHRRRRVRSSSDKMSKESMPPSVRHARQQQPNESLKDDNEIADAMDTYRAVIDSHSGRNLEKHEKKYAEFARKSKGLRSGNVDESGDQEMQSSQQARRQEWHLALEIYESSLSAQKEASNVPFPPGSNRKRTASDFSQDTHTGVASTLIAMGGIYYKLNDVGEELQKYSEALSVYQETLGRDHPHVAGTMKNIGMVLAERGEFDAALEKFEEARRIYKACNNSKDGACCDIASAISCMGNVQNRRGELEDALKLYGEALAIYKSVSSRARELGGRSRLALQEVASTLKIMGMVHTKIGELDKAMSCFQDAIDIMRQNFSEKGSGAVVTSILSRIGGIFCKMGKLDEAMSHYQEAYDLATRTFGTTDHPEVAQVLHYIGGIHQKQGDLEDAMSCYTNAAKIYECTMGHDDPTVATTLVCIGGIMYREKNLDGALALYKEALRLNRSAFGTRHPDVIPIMKSIAAIQTKKENFEDAIEISTEVLDIKCAELGGMHPEVASTHKSIGNVHYKRGDLVNAESEYRRALSIYKQTLGDDHQSAKSAQAIVDQICKELVELRKTQAPSTNNGFFKRAPKGYESL